MGIYQLNQRRAHCWQSWRPIWRKLITSSREIRRWISYHSWLHVKSSSDLTFVNFQEFRRYVFSGACSVCPADEIHVVFDSYTELSIKDSERIRRTGAIGSIDLAMMNKYVPIPQQTDNFWTSAKNKSNLKQVARDIAIRDVHDTIQILSGMVADNEALPAVVYEQPGGTKVDLPELSDWLEEADSRLIPHTNWAINRGCKRIVVLSNDTDSIVLLLRYAHFFTSNGVK